MLSKDSMVFSLSAIYLPCEVSSFALSFTLTMWTSDHGLEPASLEPKPTFSLYKLFWVFVTVMESGLADFHGNH